MAHYLPAVLLPMLLFLRTASTLLHASGSLLPKVVMLCRRWRPTRAIDHHCHALGMLQQLYQRPTAMMSSSLAGKTPSPEAPVHHATQSLPF